MIGTIRTKERCPVCGGKFALQQAGIEADLLCPKCLTRPKRVFLDLFHEGKRTKIYSDRKGRIFESVRHALRTLETIRNEMDEQHSFDRTRYVKRDLREVQVKHLAEKWLKHYEANQPLKPNSLAVKRRCLDFHLIPKFGDRDLRDLRKRHFIELLDEIPVSRQKLNMRAQLAAFLSWAFYTEELLDRPLRLPSVYLQEKPISWYTPEQRREILEQTKPHYHPILTFILTYGTRRGEAAGLMWDCVDFDKVLADDEGNTLQGEIRIKRNFTMRNLVTVKEGREKALPMTEEIRRILLDLKARRKKIGAGFVFLNRWGRPYSENLSSVWKAACRAAGYPTGKLHMARHSFVMERLGMFTYEQIGAVLGHKNVRTTERYGRLETRSMIKVVSLAPSLNRPRTKQTQEKSESFQGHQ